MVEENQPYWEVTIDFCLLERSEESQSHLRTHWHKENMGVGNFKTQQKKSSAAAIVRGENNGPTMSLDDPSCPVRNIVAFTLCDKVRPEEPGNTFWDFGWIITMWSQQNP